MGGRKTKNEKRRTKNSVLEQYVLHGHEYQLLMKSGSGKVRSQVVAGFEIDVESLFAAEKNLAEHRRLLGQCGSPVPGGLGFY